MNTLLLSLQILLFGLLPQGPAAVSDGFSGLWETNYGRMRLNVEGSRVRGSYATVPTSRIEGEVRGGVLEFRYTEPDASGEGRFELGADGRTLEGQWRVDGAQSWSPWSARRVDPRPGVRWLVVLEARSESRLHEPEVAFGGMLRSFLALDSKLEVRERHFHDEADFRRFSREVAYLAEPAYLMISTHGTAAGLSVAGRTIEPETIAESLGEASNVRLLHLAGCDLMRGDFAERIRANVAEAQRFPISGYTTTVDWAASALSDFTYLTFVLLHGMSPERALQQTHLASPYTAGEPTEGSVLQPLGLDLLPTTGDRRDLPPRTSGPGKFFGFEACWLDDVDEDGWNDIAIPDPDVVFGNGPGRRQGVVVVVSGRDGHVLRALRPRAGDARFGRGLATADDLDGDGIGELVIAGGSGYHCSGFLRCLSPVSGSLHWERESVPSTDYAGGLRELFDMDSDGVRDLAVWGSGAGSSESKRRVQRLWVVSGSNGGTIANDELGSSRGYVAHAQSIGDADGDGISDMVSKISDGAPGYRLQITSGSDGKVQREISLEQRVVRGPIAADVDRDGTPELLVIVENAIPESEDSNLRGPRTSLLALDPLEGQVVQSWPLEEIVGSPTGLAGFQVLTTERERLLILGMTPAFGETVLGFDLDSEEVAWQLPAGGPTTENYIPHFGEYVRIDPRPVRDGAPLAITGNGNPFMGGDQVLFGFDPFTGETKFRLRASGLYAEAGLH